MIIDCYDIDKESIVNLKDFYGEPKHLIDISLIIFSLELHSYLLNTFKCEKIATISACNGDTSIYKFNYKGKEIAFYLSSIGSSLASNECVEVNYVTGATKFIMFGSCGSLDKEKTHGKFIVPTESFRGEGTSYYFKKPSSYLKIKNSNRVSLIFDKLNVPYVLGKVWTTDSMLRETKKLVNKRKEEGCIAVEMELAGVQSVCDFYNFELYNFLEAGDVLEVNNYNIEGLNEANHSLGKLYIALEMALLI